MKANRIFLLRDIDSDTMYGNFSVIQANTTKQLNTKIGIALKEMFNPDDNEIIRESINIEKDFNYGGLIFDIEYIDDGESVLRQIEIIETCLF